jgi:carbon-monoxide dehydrogenase large subunit
MPGSILGTAVVRVEDPALLVGASRYVDDVAVDGVLHLVFLRSSMAHATIEGVDAAEARRMPGVVAVFTADDLDLADHFGFAVLNPQCGRPPLAKGRVRFVGDCVAAVVASSPSEAVDAAEHVIVDYDPRPAVVDMEDALAADAPVQFDGMDGNVAAGFRHDPGEDFFADADVVVRGRFENQRIAVAPLEGNAILVEPAVERAVEPAVGRSPLTIHVSTQMPHILRDAAASYFEVPPDEVRVVTPDVGGGFGGKAGMTAEHVAVIAAARALGR